MKQFLRYFFIYFFILTLPASGYCLDYTATSFNRLDSKGATDFFISPGGKSFVYTNSSDELVVANYSKDNTVFTNYSQFFPDTIGSGKLYKVLGIGDNGKVIILFQDNSTNTCTVRSFTSTTNSVILSFPTTFYGFAFHCAFNQQGPVNDWGVAVGLSGELIVAGSDNDSALKLTSYTEEGSTNLLQREELPSGFAVPTEIFINNVGSIALPSSFDSRFVIILNKNGKITEIKSRLRNGSLEGFSNNGKLLFDNDNSKYAILEIKTKKSVTMKRASNLNFIDFSDIELPLSNNGLVSSGRERTFECYFRGSSAGMKASAVGFLSKNTILAKLSSEADEDLGIGVVTAHVNHSTKRRC